MALPNVNGFLAPFLQSRRRSFDPTRGFIFRAEYKGLSLAQMAQAQENYINAGVSCELIELQGGSCMLEVEDGTQQYTLDTWEVVGNEEHREGFSHPTVMAILTDNQIAAVRTGIDNLQTGDTIDSILADPVFAGVSPTNKATIKLFIGDDLRGASEYRRGQYVLRHTTNAPNRWTKNVSDIGVDFVYTTSQLLTETQNANLWVLPIPDRLAYKISNIPTPSGFANFRWGWLKSASTETNAANNRINIATEFTLDMWPLYKYPAF